MMCSNVKVLLVFLPVCKCLIPMEIKQSWGQATKRLICCVYQSDLSAAPKKHLRDENSSETSDRENSF